MLVAQPPWLAGSAAVEWSGERLWGTIFGFAGAALAAGGYICIRLIGKREHPLSVAMWWARGLGEGRQVCCAGMCGVKGLLAACATCCLILFGLHTSPTCLFFPSPPPARFHSAAFVSSVIPLSAGYPEPAVPLTPAQFGVLLGIACGSFGGSLLVNRAFQLELAAKASAVNFTQACAQVVHDLHLSNGKVWVSASVHNQRWLVVA